MAESSSDPVEELKRSLEAERIRRVEAELRLVDNELEMRHKDDLLASMSHELRTAVKYTPSGGEMGLKVEEILDPHCMRFTVWDSSEGEEEMENSDLMRELLTRGSREASELAGTGWSLSLVKQLVELHDGRIEIESRRGEGNRFTVDLPAVDDAEVDQAPA